MKKLLYVLGGIVLLIAVLVPLVFWLASGAVASAEKFLSLAGDGRIQEAYLSTARIVQAQQDEAAFGQALERLGLTRYRSANWGNRSIQSDRARVEGTITTVDGGTLPLVIELIKEDDDWKVLTVSGPSAGVVTEGGRPLPSDAELTQMSTATLRQFNQGLQAGDLADFHTTISARWQAQITPQQLNDAFRSMLDARVDLSGVDGAEPVFDDAPGIADNGILNLSGYYLTAAGEVLFDLDYVYEHPDWKLFGIQVSTPRQVADEIAAPAEPATIAEDSEEGAPAEDAPSTAVESSDGMAFRVLANEERVGRLGRLLVSFPEGSNTSGARIEVYPAGQSERSTSAFGTLAADLLPGSYDVVISGQRVPGVTVESRHDTEVRVGVLRVTAGSGTRIRIFSGPGEDTEIASAFGSTDFGLPAGTYQVLISGQRAPVTIAAGAIVDF